VQLWEGIRLAMIQLKTEKLKSFFSLLGVIIGVMFLIVVVSVVEGMDRYIRENVASQLFGVNTVTLRRTPEGDVNTTPEERRGYSRRPLLTYADADALRAQLSMPSRVLVESRIGGSISGDNGLSVTGAMISGASEEVFAVRNLTIEKGRPFSPQEAERGVPVIVLGKETAEVIFGAADPIDHTVRIRGFPYRVIGVLAERGSIFGQSLDNLAIAPARSPIQSITNPHGVVDEVILQTIDPADLLKAKGEAEGIMRVRRRLRPAEPNNFALETVDETISFWDNISTILFTALPGLVAISLVVGGIVIMNIMLVSVMERTREIGVRKALGARRRDIMTQVVIESTTLSTVGAALGVAIGVGLALIVRTLSPLPAAIDIKWITVGVLLGTTVGITAGVYPASRASRLNPVDALRHE
jgi:putative ABC transport system permease protein